MLWNNNFSLVLDYVGCFQFHFGMLIFFGDTFWRVVDFRFC